MRRHLAWTLLLVGACSAGESGNGTAQVIDNAGGDDGAGQTPADGDGNGDDGNASDADGNGGDDGADGNGSDGDEGSGVDGIDPSDPPVPTAACGEDLDVKNGRVIPDFDTDANGGTFEGDPIENGDFQVLVQDQTLPNPDSSRNDYNVTTYAPSSDGSTVAGGAFPLLVLLPGFSAQHTGYRHFTDHFVSHGIAVLGISPANVAFTDAPNNPANVDEIIAAVEWALGESQLAGKIDEDKLAIAGHSQGGKLAFFTAVTDPRFKIVLGWDPQNGGGAPCFVAGLAGQDCNAWPVAPSCDGDRSFEDSGMLANIRGETLVFAARDTTITPDSHLWAENFYRGAPSPASLALFPSAGHGDWGAGGATTDITKRVQMALLLTRFKGVKGLESYLPTGDYLKGESSVEVHTK